MSQCPEQGYFEFQTYNEANQFIDDAVTLGAAKAARTDFVIEPFETEVSQSIQQPYIDECKRKGLSP